MCAFIYYATNSIIETQLPQVESPRDTPVVITDGATVKIEGLDG